MTTVTQTWTSPAIWGRSLSGAPVLDRSVTGLAPALVRRWQGISPSIDQAALDRHFVSIHLGGSKRLFRWGEGNCRTRDVNDAAHSVVPAGAAFRWDTHGPVDFAHIYFEQAVVARAVVGVFDRDPATVVLEERLGESDPLIASLALSLLVELERDEVQDAYLDDILHLLLCRMLRLHSNVRGSASVARHSLAPFRLRRALDFIEASLAERIGVSEIAGASGVSPFHFSRAFRAATGRSPYAYLLDRRVALAKILLRRHDPTLTAIARDCGFASSGQFSRVFRRITGLTPSAYRDRD